jgi:hypothetical protein
MTRHSAVEKPSTAKLVKAFEGDLLCCLPLKAKKHLKQNAAEHVI